MLEDDIPGNAAVIRVKRDKTMSQFGWAWKQVTPLCEEYSKNEAFKSEVQEIVKQVEVPSDPRRKRNFT